MTIIRPRHNDLSFANASLARYRANRKARERAFRRRQAAKRFIHDLMEPEMTFLLVCVGMVLFIALSQLLAVLHQA